MSQITTLIQDIYKLFTSSHTPDPQNVEIFGNNVARIVADKLQEPPQRGYLRPSNIGHPCERKLWYTVNAPEAAEPVGAKAKFKFLYGDLIEALVLFLAAEAGHQVEGMQDEMELHGVKGKRDAVIDGVLTDVKSANTRSYDKFDRHLLDQPGQDSFGYRNQLRFYLEASDNDPKVQRKDRACFLAVDKELGDMCLDWHDKDETDWEALIASKRAMLESSEPPDRSFEDVEEGKSGNRRLTVPCTYCEFKKTCWPGLRTFLYSNGPMYLTHVVKEPKPQEITDGRIA